jgi:asparagine synthase (glutamine-hydrolysing)
MTALAGFWSFGGEHDPGGACAGMLKSQALYGPDGAARWGDPAISIGRSLFRTLPEDQFDRGPILSEDGTLALVADLRLDNRSELLRDLGRSAKECRLLSDAAVLMRALQRWREDAVERLVGCFAFALWDSSQQKLLLARDFLGQRPLYFHRGADFFAFSSMVKGLHCLPEIPFGANSLRSIDTLALLPKTGPETFYAGIERVEPGHMAIVSRQGVSSRRYWAPKLEPLRLKDAREYEEGLREKLDEAVRAQLRGGGNRLASHLSGGLDSAAVTATAARQLGPEAELFAFTAAPREGFVSDAPVISDESLLASATARLYPNIRHVLVRSEGRSPLATLDRDFFLFESPAVSLCNGVWNNAINDAARDRGLRVMLTGLTGNLGMSHDGFDLLPELFSRRRLWQLARTAISLRRNQVRWGTIASASFSPFLPRSAWRLVSRLRGHGSGPENYSALKVEALTPTLAARAARSGADLSHRPLRGPAARLASLGRLDLGNFNKGTLAGWGIDHRDPTADRRLIEFCLRIPAEHYIAGGMPRSLARRSFADRLPPEVVGERRRGYQAADWHEQLTAIRPEVEEELQRIAACRESEEIIDVGRLQALLDNWPAGGWERPSVQRDYRHVLLNGLAVGHFLRRCAGSNG